MSESSRLEISSNVEDDDTDLASVEDLIQQVKIRPVLYHFGTDDYRNRTKTTEAWNDIALALNKSGKLVNALMM